MWSGCSATPCLIWSWLSVVNYLNLHTPFGHVIIMKGSIIKCSTMQKVESEWWKVSECNIGFICFVMFCHILSLSSTDTTICFFPSFGSSQHFTCLNIWVSICLYLLSMNIPVQYCTIGPCALAINDRCNYPKEMCTLKLWLLYSRQESRVKKEEFKGEDHVKQKKRKNKTISINFYKFLGWKPGGFQLKEGDMLYGISWVDIMTAETN